VAEADTKLRGSFLSRAKSPVRSNKRSVPSEKPATAIRPLGTRVSDVPAVYIGIVGILYV